MEATLSLRIPRTSPAKECILTHGHDYLEEQMQEIRKIQGCMPADG
jgi:hypothetical protein